MHGRRTWQSWATDPAVSTTGAPEERGCSSAIRTKRLGDEAGEYRPPQQTTPSFKTPQALGSSPVPTEMALIPGLGCGMAPAQRDAPRTSVRHTPRGPADQLERARTRAKPGTGTGTSEQPAPGAATGPCSPRHARFVSSLQARPVPKKPSRLRPRHSTRSPSEHSKNWLATAATDGDLIGDRQAGDDQTSARPAGRWARNASAGQHCSSPCSRAHSRSPAANAVAGTQLTRLAGMDSSGLALCRASWPAGNAQH